MSAFTKAPFAVVAPLLEDYGYQPVPIKPGFKAPMLYNWSSPRLVEAYLPHIDPETGRRTNCGAWGTGILAANNPAIDLDIRDCEVVRVLIELADEMLGVARFRIGEPPKALLLYRAEQPFDKIQDRWWALPGEDFSAEGYKGNRIEVLASGQQFVASARHPRGNLLPLATILPDLAHARRAGADRRSRSLGVPGQSREDHPGRGRGPTRAAQWQVLSRSRAEAIVTGM